MLTIFFSITLTIGKSGDMKSGEAERFREQSWVSGSWFLYVFVLIGFSFEFLLFSILFLMLWLRVETLYKFKLWIKTGSLCCCYCCLSDTIIISIVLCCFIHLCGLFKYWNALHIVGVSWLGHSYLEFWHVLVLSSIRDPRLCLVTSFFGYWYCSVFILLRETFMGYGCGSSLSFNCQDLKLGYGFGFLGFFYSRLGSWPFMIVVFNIEQVVCLVSLNHTHPLTKCMEKQVQVIRRLYHFEGYRCKEQILYLAPLSHLQFNLNKVLDM